MIDDAIYKSVQKELQEGRLSKALGLLLEATEEKDTNLKEDLLLLKSKFEYYRNQYEIKGILTDKEFNIYYSKTVLGIQDVLEKLKNGADVTAGIGDSPSNDKAKNYQGVVLGVLVIIVLGFGTYAYSSFQANKNKVAIDQQEEVANSVDSTFRAAKPTDQKKDDLKPEVILKKESEKPSTANKKEADTNTTPVEKKQEKEEVVVAKPPAKTFEVSLILNSDMSDAKIFVDGQPAIILSRTLNFAKIRVTEKQTNHVFKLESESKSCEKELFISTDKQQLIINC